MVPHRDHALRRLLLITAALLSFALPAAAHAAGSTSTAPASALDGSTSPFAIGVPESQATTTTATTPTVAATSTSTATNGSFDSLDIVIIVAGVGVLIVGTWLFVIRDARKTGRRLRGGKPAVADGVTRSGSKPAPRTRKLSTQEKRRRKRGRAPRRR